MATFKVILVILAVIIGCAAIYLIGTILKEIARTETKIQLATGFFKKEVLTY